MGTNGILVGGNWIIDQVKVIDIYPEEEKLSNILAKYSCNGGSAYNVLKALCKLNAGFKLYGIGRVGDDERGNRIIEDCISMDVDTDQLLKTDLAPTSYTDVMTVKSTGKRTFFHHRGANALLKETDFDFRNSDAMIFHLGYLLLLDQLDVLNADGISGAAVVLKRAQQHGLITSVDIVSENSSRFKEIIPCALPYIDYLFINEFEAQMLTGIATVCHDGKAILEKCEEAASEILKMGVNQWVILHFPEGAIALSKNNEFIFQPSINLPADKVKGSVGAGDAFAAGVLMGIHDKQGMKKSLQLGVCAAATCLFEPTSSDGILSSADCLLLPDLFGFKQANIKA